MGLGGMEYEGVDRTKLA